MADTPKRQGLAARRGMVALAAGIVALVVTLLAGASVPVALTGGWGITALVIFCWVWLQVGRMSPDETKTHAQAEDSSRVAADLAVLTASVASLLAIGYVVSTASNRQEPTKALLILLAVSVVAVSWLSVHTLFMLRYGDLYYGHPIGGVDFNNDDERPDYHDFAYLAFTIGMTFQVSDTNLSTKPIRRLATRHALLSFVFVAVILALTINSVASLLQ
jgi:uncharacterized membrane protein